MITFADVDPHVPTLKSMKDRNDHLGILLVLAELLEDSTLVLSLRSFVKLAAPEGITKELQPLRDLLYRVTMEQARARMSADAFRAVYMAT